MTRILRKIENEDSYSHGFRDGKQISSGTFCMVFEVINSENGEAVAAIKKVKLSGLEGTVLSCIRQEVRTWYF